MKKRRYKKLFYLLSIELVIVVFLLLTLIVISNINTSKKENKKEYAKGAVATSLEGADGDIKNTFVLSQEHEILEESDALISEDDSGESLDDTLQEETPLSGGDDTFPEGTAGSSSVDEEYIETLQTAQAGTLLQTSGAVDVVFYMQTDERWANLYYGGTDTMETYACGPTSMSIVVSSLTDIKIDPVQMAAWANSNGYWYPQSGSLHSLIPDAAAAFGLQADGVENTSKAKEKIKTALEDGKLVVALMGKGQFTQSGHFIVLRGITEDGKIIVVDPASEERTKQTFDIETITSEAKAWADANGPFWIIEKTP